MVKKSLLLGVATAACTFAAVPAQAAQWDWDWQVGDFYIGTQAGMTHDKGVKSGNFSGTTPADRYNRAGGSHRRWGGRSMFGYIHRVSDTSWVGLETSYGDYGTRTLTRGYNGATGSSAAEPSIKMHYTGYDFMLQGLHAIHPDHVLKVKAGLQNLSADLKALNWDVHAANFATRAAVETKFKAGVGYEYNVKETVGMVFDLTHVFGDRVDDYQVYPVNGGVKNQPNNVPSITSLFWGFNLYF